MRNCWSRLILPLVFVSLTGNVPLALRATAGAESSRELKILADRDLFHAPVLERMEAELEASSLEKIGILLPDNGRPSLGEIKRRYGQADTITEERMPAIKNLPHYEEIHSRRALGPRWTKAQVHYYGNVGFGIDAGDTDGPVLFITNRADHAYDSWGQEENRARIGPGAAEASYDGNWEEGISRSNLSFTVVDNAVTSAKISNINLLGCSDGGDITSTFDPPIQVIDDSISTGIVDATSRNVWLVDFSGSFSSPSSISGEEDVIILGSCGFSFGFTTFTARRQLDYALFSRRSFRSILSGQSSLFTIGVEPLGSFNQPVNIQLNTPQALGVTLNLSSSIIQPGAVAELTVNTADNAPLTFLRIEVSSSTGSATHRTTVELDLHTFRLTIAPESATVGIGQQATFNVASETFNFKQPVTLSSSVSPSGEGVSVSFASSTFVPGQSTSFTVTQSAATPIDSFLIRVRAQAAGISESSLVSFDVSRPDFSIDFGPTAHRIKPGGNISFEVAATAVAGFTQPISLDVSVSPADGKVTALAASTALGPGQKTTISVTAAPSARITSSYDVRVKGSSGGTSHSNDTSVIVSSPNFSVLFDPADVSGSPGAGSRANLQIIRVAGFTGNVTVNGPDASQIGIKVKPGSSSTTDASLAFKLKLKPNAALGLHDLVFSGQDDSGRVRTGVITLLVHGRVARSWARRYGRNGARAGTRA